jgi:hypothetical protein
MRQDRRQLLPNSCAISLIVEVLSLGGNHFFLPFYNYPAKPSIAQAEEEWG